MEAFLAERSGIKQSVVPQSVTGSVVSGDRVPMKNLHRVVFLISVAAAASDALTATIRQHDAASSGNSKDLSTKNPFYHKVNTETKFTKVEPSSAQAEYDLHSYAGQNKGLFAIEVLQEDLDVENDFNHVSVNVEGDATGRIVGAIGLGEADKKPAYDLDL